MPQRKKLRRKPKLLVDKPGNMMYNTSDLGGMLNTGL